MNKDDSNTNTYRMTNNGTTYMLIAEGNRRPIFERITFRADGTVERDDFGLEKVISPAESSESD